MSTAFVLFQDTLRPLLALIEQGELETTRHEQLAQAARVALAAVGTRLGRVVVPADLGLTPADMAALEEQAAEEAARLVPECGTDFPMGDLMHGILWFGGEEDEAKGTYPAPSESERAAELARFALFEPLLAEESRIVFTRMADLTDDELAFHKSEGVLGPNDFDSLPAWREHLRQHIAVYKGTAT